MFLTLFVPSSSLSGVFSPSLNTFAPRCPHLGCGAEQCPAVGQWELAGTGCVWPGAAPVSSLLTEAPPANFLTPATGTFLFL